MNVPFKILVEMWLRIFLGFVTSSITAKVKRVGKLALGGKKSAMDESYLKRFITL